MDKKFIQEDNQAMGMNHVQEPNRKVYTSPKLVEYGNIADLTKTLVNNPQDVAFAGTSPQTLVLPEYTP
jgi:hypothetical protein